MEQKNLEKQLEFQLRNENKIQRFGIRQMLGLMTFVSFGLAAGKFLIQQDYIGNSNIHNNADNYFIVYCGILSSLGYILNKSSIIN